MRAIIRRMVNPSKSSLWTDIRTPDIYESLTSVSLSSYLAVVTDISIYVWLVRRLLIFLGIPRKSTGGRDGEFDILTSYRISPPASSVTCNNSWNIPVSQLPASALRHHDLRCALGAARHDTTAACYEASILHMIYRDAWAHRITRDVAIIRLYHTSTLQDCFSTIKLCSLGPLYPTSTAQKPSRRLCKYEALRRRPLLYLPLRRHRRRTSLSTSRADCCSCSYLAPS